MSTKVDRKRGRVLQKMIVSRLSLLLTCIVLSSGLVGCVSVGKQEVDQHLADYAFPKHQQYKLETENDIFELSEAAVADFRSTLPENLQTKKKMDWLITYFFSGNKKKIRYSTDANLTATQSFYDRTANCLSLSILAYALAKEMGFEPEFQEVAIPEYWVSNDNYRISSQHINIKLEAIVNRAELDDLSLLLMQDYNNDNNYNFKKIRRELEVDFSEALLKQKFIRTTVTKRQVFGMFYNNKGAMAIVEGELEKAYAYLKQALLIYPEDSSTWLNLGVLYRKSMLLELAKSAYLTAIDLDFENYTARDNLALLYRLQNDRVAAARLEAFNSKKRADNPFYFIFQGDKALAVSEFKEAIRLYKKAIKLYPRGHEAHFGLAKAYFELGKTELSLSSLEQAKAVAAQNDTRNKYQGKIDWLSQLQLAK